jgi:hypothetical protein
MICASVGMDICPSFKIGVSLVSNLLLRSQSLKHSERRKQITVAAATPNQTRYRYIIKF